VSELLYEGKPLNELTIEEAAAGLAAGAFTSRQITEVCLAHIEAHDTVLNCFVMVTPEIARAQADASDARRAAGKSLGILDGVPYNLKDVFAMTDSPTTASSHMLEGWVAPYNATTYTNLREAGAVLLGKTNTDEFTMGTTSETSYFGVTRNPWDSECVAGGSSGGPAASIAAHMSIFSIGTDTGGSIRLPAAFCGVVGVKPTYGRVSRFGEIAMASSLDQTGPITKTARDAAIVLEVLAGEDPLDATSSAEPVPNYLKGMSGLKGMTIGVPKEFFGEGINPEVEARVRESIKEMEAAGAKVVEISMPAALHSLAAYYIIVPAEVSSNMSRYDGIRYGYSVEREETHAEHSLYDVYAKSRAQGIGAEVKRRIMLGNHVLSSGYYDAYYAKAEAVRAVVRQEFDRVFAEGVDVIAAPVSTGVAFKVGEKINDPLAMYKEDVLTVPGNISGTPSIAVPCGFVDGMPVGLQLIGPRFGEGSVLRAAAAYQELTTFHQEKAKLQS